MKVFELAQQLKVSPESILLTLKNMKLKAKDGEQELSSAVVTVIKSEVLKNMKSGFIKEIKSVTPSTSKEKILAKVSSVTTPKEAKEAKSAKKKAQIEKEKIVEAEKEDKKNTANIKVNSKEEINLEIAEEMKSKSLISAKKKIEEEVVVKDLVRKNEMRVPVKEIVAEKAIPSSNKIDGASKVVVPAVVKDVKQAEVRLPERKHVPGEISKPKIVISSEPVITLKPLAHRRKKGMHSPMGGRSADVVHGAGLHPIAADMGTQVSLETPAIDEQPKNLQELEIQLPVTVKDFSVRIQQKPSAVLMTLMKMGLMAHINQSLDGEVITKLASTFGFTIVKVKTQEEQLFDVHQKEDENPELLKERPPVVTFMGHVDHGKTSLIDYIRKSRVADKEHGGITQHMGAYSVQTAKGKITILDTPGHEAFTAMRARGAHITDLVVLVVAADEGIMPQTEEAIDHARAANVPIIVALNKIDKRNADIERVKKQLMGIDLMAEDWGGKTITVGVSAETGEGIDTLLEMISLESEILELRANAEKLASGIVVEAHMSGGRGAVATFIVQTGTLKDGDIVVAGAMFGKVKAMTDDLKKSVKSAGPSAPVEVVGLPAVPEAGEKFYVVADEKVARDISEKRKEHIKNQRMSSVSKLSLEDLQSQIEKGILKELNIIIKADVQGSLEALKDSFGKIPNDKIKIRLIHTGVGGVNTSDIILAHASKAIVVAFHVDIDSRAKSEMERHPVDVRQYRIIYDAVNDIRKALEGLLEVKKQKRFISRVEVREVFKLTRGVIAGCYVQKGKIIRKSNIDIMRGKDIVFTGVLNSLKRFKDDVREVNEGMECGIMLDNFEKFEVGDMIEAYELDSISQKL